MWIAKWTLIIPATFYRADFMFHLVINYEVENTLRASKQSMGDRCPSGFKWQWKLHIIYPDFFFFFNKDLTQSYIQLPLAFQQCLFQLCGHQYIPTLVKLLESPSLLIKCPGLAYKLFHSPAFKPQ